MLTFSTLFIKILDHEPNIIAHIVCHLLISYEFYIVSRLNLIAIGFSSDSKWLHFFRLHEESICHLWSNNLKQFTSLRPFLSTQQSISIAFYVQSNHNFHRNVSITNGLFFGSRFKIIVSIGQSVGIGTRMGTWLFEELFFRSLLEKKRYRIIFNFKGPLSFTCHFNYRIQESIESNLRIHHCLDHYSFCPLSIE